MHSCQPRYFSMGAVVLSTLCALQQDGEAGGVDAGELLQRQGIRAGAHLDGEAGTAVGLDEPVLVCEG